MFVPLSVWIWMRCISSVTKTYKNIINLTGFHLLCSHAVCLAQYGTQQGLEVQAEAHG